MFDYFAKVVIPSAALFWGSELGGLSDLNYYSYPWEYQADQYGGVKRKYADWAEDYSNYYWNKGLSVRQLSRLTGTSKGLVEKYLKAGR